MVDSFARFQSFRVCLQSAANFTYLIADFNIPIQIKSLLFSQQVAEICYRPCIHEIEYRDNMPRPEELARVKIDKFLTNCGLALEVMCGLNRYASIGVAEREFSVPMEVGNLL